MNLFRTLCDPTTHAVAGADVRNIWQRSGLDNDTLAVIWELADVDDDGALGEGEFIVGMHLVDQTREGRPLPDSLSRELQSVVTRR